MSEPNSPLEPRVLEILRDAPRPTEDVRARVRARLMTPVSGPGGRGPSGQGGASAAPSGLGINALVGIAFLVGGAGGALLHAALSRPAAPVVVYVDRPVLAPSAVIAPQPGAGVPPIDAPIAAASVAAPSHAPSAPLAPSQLAAERALLDQARTALVQGDPARALERVQKHRRTFLNPMLAEERDAMEVEALVRLGRSDEARNRAEAFRKRFPDSLFLSTVQSAVESIP